MKTINEAERLVVFGEAIEKWRADERVCLYRHDDIWCCTDSPDAQYSHFYWLCGNEGLAQLAEEGSLLVNGNRLLAEEYLSLWRKAFSVAVPVESLQNRMILEWDIRISAAAIESNRDKFTSEIAGVKRGANHVLEMACEYADAWTDGMRRWVLPFGKKYHAEVAKALADLGSRRYSLPPGSHKRLTVRIDEHFVVPKVESQPDSQLSLLEGV